MSKFQEDLVAAKPAEELVRKTLSRLSDDYLFVDVADKPKFYHYGDIAAIGEDFKVKFLDVKDDSRIADTRNILCEEVVYDKRNDREEIGFMFSNYDYICIVSKKESRIYIIDFKILQKIYKKGEPRIFDHPTQYTEGYLLPLYVAKKYKALVAKINYDTLEVDVL